MSQALLLQFSLLCALSCWGWKGKGVISCQRWTEWSQQLVPANLSLHQRVESFFVSGWYAADHKHLQNTEASLLMFATSDIWRCFESAAVASIVCMFITSVITIKYRLCQANACHHSSRNTMMQYMQPKHSLRYLCYHRCSNSDLSISRCSASVFTEHATTKPSLSHMAFALVHSTACSCKRK